MRRLTVSVASLSVKMLDVWCRQKTAALSVLLCYIALTSATAGMA